jgi:hypothetical protein
LTRKKYKERIAMNRPSGSTKLAAGLLGILLAGFSLPGRAQTMPPGTIVPRMATQNPVPLPHKGFLDSDYGLLSQGGSVQEETLAYISPSANRKKTVWYSLLFWPRTSLFTQIEAEGVNRRNAIFGSTDLTIADSLIPANGITPHFRPLLEIQLGAYKLPMFLYVPNPQAN